MEQRAVNRGTRRSPPTRQFGQPWLSYESSAWDLRRAITPAAPKRRSQWTRQNREDAMTQATPETRALDRLLVVDDQEADIQELTSKLGDLGFEIVSAKNWQAVERTLQNSRPDLILLSLNVAGVDGFDLCRRIQERGDWSDIPIIFVSAVDDHDLLVRALEGGGVDYISKPLRIPELLARLRTQLMLKTALNHARRLAQDKDELLGVISHYLQNHLAGLNMSAQGLLNRAQHIEDSKLRLMAENIRASTMKMRAFVRTFLANSAAEHGLAIKLETVNLRDAVSRAVAHYEDAAKQKEVSFRVKEEAESLAALADPMALDQVLDNLVSNALKFSPPGKDVFVSLRAHTGYVECLVRDQGSGFTEEDKPRMFNRYARLSARPTADEPSTGLGLSIARKLMREMNGELSCESIAGAGATFIVRLPAANAGS